MDDFSFIISSCLNILRININVYGYTFTLQELMIYTFLSYFILYFLFRLFR